MPDHCKFFQIFKNTKYIKILYLKCHYFPHRNIMGKIEIFQKSAYLENAITFKP